MISTENLKMVKASFVKVNDGKIIIQHYSTDIFEYDPQTEKAVIRKSSQTTNKMINRCISHFNVSEKNIMEAVN